MLLKFRVANVLSFRDEQSLSFVATELMRAQLSEQTSASGERESQSSLSSGSTAPIGLGRATSSTL